MLMENKMLWLFRCDVIIFSSGCYAPYNSIIATPLQFLRLPLSSIFCFFVALGPALQSLGLQLHVDVDYPVLIPSRSGYRKFHRSEILSRCSYFLGNFIVERNFFLGNIIAARKFDRSQKISILAST